MKNGLRGLEENLDVVGNIIEKVRVAMLTTFDQKGVPSCRPMWVQEVDAHRNVWFFTSTQYVLSEQVRENPQVQLTFSDTGKNLYLAAKATATEIQDKEKMKDLWDPTLKAWFPDGLETPDITLLKVRLDECDFWDSPHTAVVRAAGFVKAALTDEKYEPGRQRHVEMRH